MVNLNFKVLLTMSKWQYAFSSHLVIGYLDIYITKQLN